MEDSRTHLIRKTLSMLVSLVKCGDDYDKPAEGMVKLAFHAIDSIEKERQVIETPPPKDGKRYMCHSIYNEFPIGCWWNEVDKRWGWDVNFLTKQEVIPTGYVNER